MRTGVKIIGGMAVEMVEIEGRFAVLGDGKHLGLLIYTSRDGEEHGRWLCDACHEESGKKGPMLAHVVFAHAMKTTPVVSARGRTLEAILTPLKLVGMHTDPTYDAAIERRYGRYAW